MWTRILITAAFTGNLLGAAYTGVDAGSITGEVNFLDVPANLAPVKISKDQDFCGEILPNETYIVSPGGGLKNVVVFIEAAPARTAADPDKVNILENDGCRYVPRILAMRKGERLRVKNNDPKLHIPHSYLHEKTVFMLSLPFKNSILEATRKIKDAGIMKVVCDTHAWMLGYIHVFDHPFFAVTDARGAFSIANLPPGAYTIKAWHEDAGIRTEEITVPESADARVNFEFTKQTPVMRE